eukprot:m.241064 g.241064  ORF g.241064 m.241064 type:complete len:657 (-) comp23915_c0_seq1:59-2029(-)
MMTAEAERSPERMVLREKFGQLWEQLLKGEDPSQGKETFWQELFLLKVKSEFLEKQIAAIPEEQLLAQKDSINTIFGVFARYLKDENDIRVANVLQTMAVLLAAIFKKKFANFGFDVVNLLVGFDQAEAFMKDLLRSLQQLLKPQSPAVLRGLTLNLLVVLATATDNVNENALLEYFMLHSIFETIALLLRTKDLRDMHGPVILFLLALLVNYRKHEAPNPYVAGLAETTDDVMLHGIGSVVLALLMSENSRCMGASPARSQSLLSSLGSLMSSLFVSSEETSAFIPVTVGTTGPALLALYETVYLSPNFVTMLTHTQLLSKPSPGGAAASGAAAAAPAPSTTAGLLSEFITYTSFLFQTPDPDGPVFVRLALITLTRIAEDLYSNMFLHDANVNIPVMLHRVALRHRPATTERLPSLPLACAVLDLLVEYLVAHLKRSIPLRNLSLALGVIHRLVAHQKRQRVRLPYAWAGLWSALMGLLRFVLPKDGPFNGDGPGVYAIATQVVAIFNVFVTYGDAFLPDAAAYDRLYYELLRSKDVFEVMNEEARSSSVDRASGARLAASLVNIRAITCHFAPKVDAWVHEHHGAVITPEQVLIIVRDNYDTLTLKLQDNIEYFEPYSEMIEAGTLRSAARASVLAFRHWRYAVETSPVIPRP